MRFAGEGFDVGFSPADPAGTIAGEAAEGVRVDLGVYHAIARGSGARCPTVAKLRPHVRKWSKRRRSRHLPIRRRRDHMPIEALRQNIRTIRTLSSTTKEPEAALKAQAKGYEDLMVGADDLQQAELLAKWTSNVGVLQRARYPSAEAWLALINRFYGLQNGDITPGSLGGPDPDPGVSQSGINPLELGLGIGACLLAAAGPGGVAAVAVMTAMSQIFGGGSEIDWNMVFSRIRSIVREEVQDIQVQNLGYEVKTLGDWMTSSLVAHPEWRPESGQFQDKLVEAQVLSGKLMYAQGSNGTQASALGFFMVAANIHLALLVAAADCSKRDGKADAARGYLDELVSYSERYARHARRLAHYLISQRSWSFQGVGGWPIPFVVREREAIFARVKGAPASLYMRLVRNYMRAAMANTLDTVEAWGRLADKARGGEIVAGVKATITPPASPPRSHRAGAALRPRVRWSQDGPLCRPLRLRGDRREDRQRHGLVGQGPPGLSPHPLQGRRLQRDRAGLRLRHEVAARLQRPGVERDRRAGVGDG